MFIEDDRSAWGWSIKSTTSLFSNPTSFFHHSDPRTRGTQRLHQEQTLHPDLFHSFFPCNLRMEPPPYLYFFSPLTRVLPESTRPQFTQPARGSHLSMNIKITYIILTSSPPVYYCFNNTQGTDRDHVLNTHRCRTCTAVYEPSP